MITTLWDMHLLGYGGHITYVMAPCRNFIDVVPYIKLMAPVNSSCPVVRISLEHALNEYVLISPNEVSMTNRYC